MVATSNFTTYGWAVCSWVLILSFQYGYHISVLNQIQAVLTCKSTSTSTYLPHPSCIPMSDFTFSVVTATLTVGGLVGSLVANIVMDRWGRRGASKVCAILIGSGASTMGSSNSVPFLILGRLLVGLGSGIGICVGPIYLAEIAPSRISGNVGVLTQLGIVSGIMFTQAAGIRFANPSEWRYVLFLSSTLSIVQYISSFLIVESPAWLANKGRHDEKLLVETKIWGDSRYVAPTQGVESPLLNNEEDIIFDASESPIEAAAQRRNLQVQPCTVPQLLVSPELRKPLFIICLAMISQQFSGINAVLYYSNDILAKSLPEYGPYVSLGITVVNFLMTFPPIILIESLGRKTLLTFSTLGALTSLVCLAYGLDMLYMSVSSIAIVTFVMSFAVGLGPIPFVMIPEVSPPRAVSALSSVALSLNWIANFFVGLTFLPLRNLLSGGDALKEGRVFYVFVAILFISTFSLSRLYRG